MLTVSHTSILRGPQPKNVSFAEFFIPTSSATSRITVNPFTAENSRSSSNSNNMSQQASGMRHLPGFLGPGEYDVICARGKRALSHPGNRRFRSMIEASLERYSKASTKLEKSLIVSQIVDAVRESSPDGGFVREEGGIWYEVGDHIAREKCGQSFRDLLHTQYRSSTKAKMQRRKIEEAKTEKEGTQVASPKLESVAAKVVVAEKNGPEDRMKVLFNEANKELLDQIKQHSNSSSDDEEPPTACAAPSAAAAPSDVPGLHLRFYPESSDSPTSASAARLPQLAFTKSVELAMDETDGAIQPPPLNERFSASIFDLPLPERGESGYGAPRHQQQPMHLTSPPRPHQYHQQRQHPQLYREQQYQIHNQRHHPQPYRHQQGQQRFQSAVMAGSRRSNNDLIDDDDEEGKPSVDSVVWRV